MSRVFESFFTINHMRSKMDVDVMLADVVKPLLAYVYVLETRKKLNNCIGYVYYQ